MTINITSPKIITCVSIPLFLKSSLTTLALDVYHFYTL